MSLFFVILIVQPPPLVPRLYLSTAFNSGNDICQSTYMDVYDIKIPLRLRIWSMACIKNHFRWFFFSNSATYAVAVVIHFHICSSEARDDPSISIWSFWLALCALYLFRSPKPSTYLSQLISLRNIEIFAPLLVLYCYAVWFVAFHYLSASECVFGAYICHHAYSAPLNS